MGIRASAKFAMPMRVPVRIMPSAGKMAKSVHDLRGPEQSRQEDSVVAGGLIGPLVLALFTGTGTFGPPLA